MTRLDELKAIQKQKEQEARLAQVKAENAWAKFFVEMDRLVDALHEVRVALEKEVDRRKW